MGKPTGFLEWTRAGAHRRPIDERLRDWREVEVTAEPAESKQQGGRCMDCGVPFCTQGCPLGNPSPKLLPGHVAWVVAVAVLFSDRAVERFIKFIQATTRIKIAMAPNR